MMGDGPNADGKAQVMDPVVALLGILGGLAVGVVSPGPSFLMIARSSVSVSRQAGLAASVGMGLGGVLFAGLALFGLHSLLTQFAWLYAGLKIVGGLYLLWMAYRLWRGASVPLTVTADGPTAPTGLWRAFTLGFVTQISNPKTAVVYGSIFAALLPAEPSSWLLLALPPSVFVVEAGWYAIVAFAFSAEQPRAAYLRSKGWVDRVAAAAMGGLGLRLVADAAPQG